jgi:4-alpha-glucanotransferase
VSPSEEDRGYIRDALELLGVRRFVLGIHDASFPSQQHEDTGRGSAYSEAGHGLLGFARDLGFDGIQFGPQGQTPEGSASPYDGTLFSRNPYSISLSRLVSQEPPWCALLARERLAAVVATRPAGSDTHVPHGFVSREHSALLHEAFAAFEAREDSELQGGFERFKRHNAWWLERDACYHALRREHGGAPPRYWGGPGDAALVSRLLHPRSGERETCERRHREVCERHAGEMEFQRFAQFVAHEQHQQFRRAASGLELRLYADLQIGFSEQDAWCHQSLFLHDYVMGAPPSRTNPEGQAWHYPVLDPAQYGDLSRAGPVLELLSARLDKTFEEYDAVRIDHPHGLVCPWVYRRDDPDPLHAVQRGARLFSSSGLSDHPALARFAIARREDLNSDPTTARHADDWVVRLSDAQVDRYAVLFDAIVASARRHGRDPGDLVCEVLSTLPYPLARVLERHGLGRFRVTQKADLRDPRDVYRSENARPADWIMLGNHDTEPIWRRIESWSARGELSARAQYLAARLTASPDERASFAERLTREPGLLAQAALADLFASPAQHVFVFFADLFGFEELYNRPGVVSDENWRLRLTRDYREQYGERVAHLRALNLPLALALALRARAGAPEQSGLVRRLEESARRISPEHDDWGSFL